MRAELKGQQIDDFRPDVRLKQPADAGPSSFFDDEPADPAMVDPVRALLPIGKFLRRVMANVVRVLGAGETISLTGKRCPCGSSASYGLPDQRKRLWCGKCVRPKPLFYPGPHLRNDHHG